MRRPPGVPRSEDDHPVTDVRKARARFVGERDGTAALSGGGASAVRRARPPAGAARGQRRRRCNRRHHRRRQLETLWRMPEVFPFCISGPDSPSEVLVSYDPEGPDRILVLPISSYLLAIDHLLEKETSWEILSYVLCHLPVQLANRHLFCGPKSRQAISKMLNIICKGIFGGEFASQIETVAHWAESARRLWTGIPDAVGIDQLSTVLRHQPTPSSD